MFDPCTVTDYDVVDACIFTLLLPYALLAHRANTTGVPAYLKEHLVQRVHLVRPAQLHHRYCLSPRLTTDFARRSFSYAAPVIWYSLPTEVILRDSEHSFKRHLKTFLFNCCHQTV